MRKKHPTVLIGRRRTSGKLGSSAMILNHAWALTYSEVEDGDHGNKINHGEIIFHEICEIL